MPTELRWIRSFTALAEILHFGRAALALGLSQSALSVQIKNLEKDLQVNLLVRDRRSVKLTAAGTIFLEGALRIQKEIDVTRKNAQRVESGEIGSLRIGFVNLATFRLMPKIIRYYKEHIPGLSLL